MAKDRAGKGTFSRAKLPVTPRYLRPHRRHFLTAGLVLALLVLAYVAYDRFVSGSAFLSNGPLSSAHANLETDCEACHDPQQAGVAGCTVCHERYGDELGTYSYAAHYVYRSGDFSRIRVHDHERPCQACHTEHRGRDGAIARVADERCLACHPGHELGSGHPEFATAEKPNERAGLRFPHLHHVREVMQRKELVDLEQACLHCHTATADGRGFEPLSYDRHCDSCHLAPTVATPELPVQSASAPGVSTLEMVRERGGPESAWVSSVSPNELRRSGDGIVKTPVRHRDPWILDNLRSIRHELYPDAGLADLLQASADAPPRQTVDLYREALATLRTYADGLRGRPERATQRELRRIDRELDRVQRLLDDPTTPLDGTRFALDLLEPDPALTADRADALASLAEAVAEPCRECHLLERATIVRVQTDQRFLRRAEFDHRAHIIQRRCLDCHRALPFEERLAGPPEEARDPRDRAELVNTPSIDDCTACHTPSGVSSQCTTCHLFHPDEERRSRLLLYLDE